MLPALQKWTYSGTNDYNPKQEMRTVGDRKRALGFKREGSHLDWGVGVGVGESRKHE